MVSTCPLIAEIIYKEIRGQLETIQNYTIIKIEYWEESWRLEETCCHSDSSEKPSASAGVKNSPTRKQ